MPGSLAEVGETSEQNVIREAREETGLEVEILELVGVYLSLPTADKPTLTVPLYLCGVTCGTLRGSHEDLGLQYWNLEQVPIWYQTMSSGVEEPFNTGPSIRINQFAISSQSRS
jgi:8-oxo-dGTP pyrophosphatase MutT (NUDIX family)